MNLFAVLPALVFVVGAGVVAFAVTRVLDELELLKTELDRARQLRPLAAAVGAETARLRLVLHRLSER